ncbi:MAG: hypothetical protein EOS10_22505 [Mesorhizobium sp.]|uniref:hypothetical protein n=1 Tax=Mesorhizobium sp. TaxID=1871066 RepID=UPI000FEA61AF|nr:hypothetical protein [Mesorhizobium sp.]RWO29616.1 MAG: hypothetical protein EOS10_22505 [Mesorhizobium sp.]
MNARLSQIPRRFIPVAPPKLSRVSVPPHGGVHLICARWPDCQCGDDCIDILPARSPAVRRILAAMLVAVALIIAGLVYAGLPS